MKKNLQHKQLNLWGLVSIDLAATMRRGSSTTSPLSLYRDIEEARRKIIEFNYQGKNLSIIKGKSWSS